MTDQTPGENTTPAEVEHVEVIASTDSSQTTSGQNTTYSSIDESGYINKDEVPTQKTTNNETVVQEQTAAFVEDTPKQRVNFRVNPLDDGEKDPYREVVPMPPDFKAYLDAAAAAFSDKYKDAKSSVAFKRWYEAVIDCRDSATIDNVARYALERTGSSWMQEIQTDAGLLGGGSPKFKSGDAGVLTGDAAVMQIMQHRKIGSMYRMPLWNTGIWITFKAPSEATLLEMYHYLNNIKVQFGRHTYGLSFGNTMAITADEVVNFALQNIHSTTLKLAPGVDLKDVISSHDIPAIIIGLASTIWPNGFNYERVCFADPDECQHIVTEKINISKTLLVDRSPMTTWMITHMSKLGRESVTLEDVKRYKEELQQTQDRRVVIDKDSPNEVVFTLRVPSINEYTQAGRKWVNQLTEMVDQALGTDLSSAERNEYVLNYGLSAGMRQFSHWVKEIEFNQKTINDEETMEQVLGTLSSDDTLRFKFMEEVGRYQADSTLTVAAVPSFKCPNCGKVNESSKFHPNITDAIPYDVYQTFFGLVVQRIRRISQR